MAYINRGLAKRALKDYYGAIADYTKAIELKPNDVELVQLYNERGSTKLYELEDYYGAIADYTKAIEIDPNYSYVYSNRGNAKQRLGDLDGACSDWRKGSNLGSRNSLQMCAMHCNYLGYGGCYNPKANIIEK